MRLSPAKFNAHLNFIGQNFLWRRAYACPDANPYSGAANLDCPTCNGLGWFWSAAPGVAGKAGMSNQGVERRFGPAGMYMAGDAILTIQASSPLYAIGHFDRIMMLNSTSPFSQKLTRDGTEKLPYTKIDSIDRVFWFDVSHAIVEGGIPTVGADGTLTWTSGAPPTGVNYSITGSAVDEYFCFRELPSDRQEHAGAPLPKKLHARKFDLFGRQG